MSEETIKQAPPFAVNPLTPQDAGDLVRRFTYHPPKGDQPARYTALRAGAGELASFIVQACPDSRERSLALTYLENAIFWANAAIARNE